MQSVCGNNVTDRALRVPGVHVGQMGGQQTSAAPHAALGGGMMGVGVGDAPDRAPRAVRRVQATSERAQTLQSRRPKVPMSANTALLGLIALALAGSACGQFTGECCPTGRLMCRSCHTPAAAAAAAAATLRS